MSYVMTAEHRAKLSAAQMGKTHLVSDAARANMSAAQMGHIMPESCRRAFLKANLGRHLSEETKAKMSTAQKGKLISPETRTKMSAAQMGHIVSLEWRAKLAATHVGTHASPETLAKLSRSHLGLKVSPETCAKISASQKGHLSHLWQGGVTPENRLIRASGKYWSWHNAVLKRDHFTCQDCGQIGGDLEAHHIHEFAQYPDERFVVENGKTLCLECHNKTKLGRLRKVKVAA